MSVSSTDIHLLWTLPLAIRALLLMTVRSTVLIAFGIVVDRVLRRSGYGALRRRWWVGIHVGLLLIVGPAVADVLPVPSATVDVLWIAQGTPEAFWKLPAATPWLLGAMVLISVNMLGHLHAHGVRRRALPADDRDLQARWRRLTFRAGCSPVPAVRISREIEVPMVVGLVRGTLLLPAAPIETTDAACHSVSNAVLAHELEHLRARDLCWRFVARCATAAHWFNPLAWVALIRLREACEEACDDAALDAGARRDEYARDLVRWWLGGETLRGSVGLGGQTFRTIERRLGRMRESRSRPKGRSAWLVTAGAVLVVATSLVAIRLPAVEVTFLPRPLGGAVAGPLHMQPF